MSTVGKANLPEAKGVSGVAVTSNGGSSSPALYQILGYSEPTMLKKDFKGREIIQIISGLLNIGIGTILILSSFLYHNGPMGSLFWLALLLMLFGVMCICPQKTPSPCLLAIAVTMCLISAVFALTAISTYADEIGRLVEYYHSPGCYEYGGPMQPTTPGMERNTVICKTHNTNVQVGLLLLIGTEVLMAIFAILQLCAAINAFVLELKAACKEETAEEVGELSNKMRIYLI